MVKIIKRTLIGILIIICLVPFVYLLSGFAICPAINDAKAKGIVRDFSKVSMPDGIEFVEASYFCGNTSGTGNHVEIWAGILVYSKLSENEVQQLYKDELMRHLGYAQIFWPVPADLGTSYPEPKSYINFP